jgi:hypothetical protein
MVRKTIIFQMSLLAGFALTLTPTPASAGMLLLPGQNVSTPGEVYPVPGTAPVTPLASQTVSFSNINPNFGGTLSVEVFREASGTLDFLYQVTSASSSQFNLAGITGGGFGTGNPFKTSVDFTTSNPDPSVFQTGSQGSISASRTAAGPQVTFNFGDSTTGGLAPGATSDIVFIQTDATAYNFFGGATISGQNVGSINPGTASVNNILEPTAASPVPEPATAVLLGIGLPLMGAYAYRRKNPRKPA